MNKPLFAPLPLEVLRRGDISANAKLVFARLKLYAGENMTAFPSMTTLAVECGTTRRCAMRSVAHLERAGLLRVVRSTGNGNVYHLTSAESVTSAQSVTSDNTDTPPVPKVSPPLVTTPTPPLVTKQVHIKDVLKRGTEKRFEKMSLSRESESQFEYFWQIYPRKEGKESARKYFKAAYAEHEANPSINRKLMGLIEEALGWQKELDEWQRDSRRWIPKPTTYLRDKRWLDERPRTNDADEHAKGF